MNLIIMNFNDERYDTGIALDLINEVDVSVISGDESIIVLRNDGKINKIDAAEIADKPRFKDYFDGSYIVYKEELPRWNKRTDSYEWINRSVFDD